MNAGEPPFDEKRRLEALRHYSILDTGPEEALDDLTALAATICDVPIASISLVDEHRQWFKSKVGMTIAETTRDVSFCAHALRQTDLFIVPDATQDARFAGSPLVTGEPGVRFYAAAPLISPEGAALGALCVIDRVPRTLTPAQEQALRVLARQVMTQFELRRQARELAGSERFLRAIFDSEPECVKLLGPDGSLRMMNRAGLAMIEADSFEQVAGDCIYHVIAPEHRAKFAAMTAHVFRGAAGTMEFQLVGLKGTPRWMETHAAPLRDESGAVTALLAITRDITDRKQAEEKLAGERNLLRTLIDSLPDVIFTKDLQGRLGISNPAHVRFAGATTEAELVGKTSFDLFPPEVAEVYQRDDQEVLTTGQPILNREEPCLNRNGAGCWLTTTKVPLRNPAGEIVGLIGVSRNITDRKQAEEALQLMRFSVDHAGDGVFWLSAEGRVLYVNESACTRLGYSHDELLGMTIFDLDPDYQRDAWRLHWAELKRCGTQTFETSHRCKDGRVFPIEVNANYVHVGEKEFNFAFSRDITARKREEEKLQRLNRLYAVSSGVNEAIVRIHETQELYAQACRIAVEQGGFCMASVGLAEPGSELLKFIARHGPEKGYLEAIQISLLPEPLGSGPSGRAYRENQTVVCNDIDTDPSLAPWREEALKRGYRSSAAFPLREAGQPIGVFAVYGCQPGVFDVQELHLLKTLTENISFAVESHRQEQLRVEAENALRANEEKFQSFFESSPDGIVVATHTGIIHDINRQAEQLFGYTRAELVGQRIETLMPGQLREDHVAQRDDYIREPHSRPMGAGRDLFARRKDGTEFPVDISLSPITTPEGRMVISTIRDITERKRLEQIALRTQRVESIGTLAGGIAHDLNNILGPIMTSLDLLKLKFPDPESQELVSILGSCAQRGADMVRQVLSFARGVEGRKMEVQIKHLIGDVEKIANDTFPKDIQVRTKVPHALWTVAGDPTQLHQVLLNLCVNARDAMPHGGTLGISAENFTLDAHYAGMNPEAKPGPYVLIHVEDNGVGMPPEIIEKIFDPFFTTKELGKGTGLGLPTSQAIVNSHGGFLRVYSEPGTGTTFDVYLPAQTGASSGAAAEVSVELPRGHGELILVVDDERSIRQITKQTLEAFGYRVLLAADGAEAVALYASRGEEIGAVLTDIMMPVMDGPALMQVLRRMNPEVPIIAASGRHFDTPRSAGVEVQGFLPKPYTAEALLNALQQALSARS